jgi:hypothetical protein
MVVAERKKRGASELAIVLREVRGLGDRMSGVERRLAGIDARLDGVDARLGAVQHRMNGFEDKMEAGFERIDLQLAELKAELKIGIGRVQKAILEHNQQLKKKVDREEVEGIVERAIARTRR